MRTCHVAGGRPSTISPSDKVGYKAGISFTVHSFVPCWRYFADEESVSSLFYLPIHSPAPSPSQRIGSSLHSSSNSNSNQPPEAVVGKCVLGLCCVVLVLYAQRITSGLFELLLHAFCKHFYWIYYTLAINFRVNINTRLERSPKRIVLLCSQHYYQVRSGCRPTTTTTVVYIRSPICCHSIPFKWRSHNPCKPPPPLVVVVHSDPGWWTTRETWFSPYCRGPVLNSVGIYDYGPLSNKSIPHVQPKSNILRPIEHAEEANPQLSIRIHKKDQPPVLCYYFIASTRNRHITITSLQVKPPFRSRTVRTTDRLG